VPATVELWASDNRLVCATVEWRALRQQIVFATEHKAAETRQKARTPLSALVCLQYTNRMVGRGCIPCSMRQRQFTKALFCPLPVQRCSCLLLSCYPQAGYRVFSWCGLDRASSIMCGNKMPTRYNRWIFYCRSYCLLNMFRAPLCPSSGAREYYASGCCLSYLVLGFQVVGIVWSWGLCVRFAGCSPKHVEQAIRFAINIHLYVVGILFPPCIQFHTKTLLFQRHVLSRTGKSRIHASYSLQSTVISF
jgi:hypothetical protein